MAALGAETGIEKLARLTVIGLLLVPLAIGGILAWALATPTAHLERVTAAIVNDDAPVTLDGQTLPIGREFAAGLMAAQEPAQPSAPPPTPTFDWVLTNDGEAAAGLASGRYVAVVTIPSSFSADATSMSGPGADARQAVVHVETTAASAWMDPQISAAVTDAAADALGRQLTSRYLGQVYDGFNSIADQIGQAAAGADQLADGAAATAEGAATLATGATALATGVAALDTGAASLSAGLARLDELAQPLPAETARLAAAANEIARSTTAAAVRSEEAAIALRAVIAAACGTPGPLCDAAQRALDRLVALDETLHTLAVATRRLAVGNDAVAAAMPPLVGGVDASASGAADVAAGAATASQGADAAANGSAEVAAGAEQVAGGADDLAGGLGEASTQLPTYTDADIATLSSVVAQPVTTTVDGPAAGMQSLPLFTMIALWFGAAVTALVVQAVPPRRLLTAARSLSIASRAIVPTVVIGVAQGVVVAIAVLIGASPTPAAGLAFTGAAALVGAVFGLVNQGLAAAFAAPGRLIAVVIGVVALAAGLASTIPPVLAAVAGGLPTQAATTLLRSALGTDAAGVGLAILGLIFAAVAGYALVLAGVLARRKVTVEKG